MFTHTHAALTNAQVFNGQTTETNPATSRTFIPTSPWFQRLCSFFFFLTTGSSRVVVALGWTDPSDLFPFLNHRVGGGVLARPRDHSSGRHLGVGGHTCNSSLLLSSVLFFLLH